jgi:hypothetical protein
MINCPKNRVAFLIPFVGQWPEWTGLFFQSCRSNPQVDVLLLSQSEPKFPLPENVCVVKISLEEMVRRFETALGLKLGKVSGHKLCDFRPFYGLAFADILRPYEFWGYCDADMMFGDLSRLLTAEFFENTDAFSAHDQQFVGHFTLLRNTDAVNRLGFQIKNWQQLVREPVTRALDEIRFSEILPANPSIRWRRPNGLPEELKTPFARFGITYAFYGEIAYLNPRDVRLCRWENGRVYCANAAGDETEALYVHFMGTKHWWHLLFWNKSRLDAQRHYFSRVGYGGVKTPRGLLRFPGKQFYGLQCALLKIKTGAGALLRKILPRQLFLAVRRRLLGRGRY